MDSEYAVPSQVEILGEADEIRRAVLGGMRRIVTGQPLRVVPGAISVRDLALESGVGRHYLYGMYSDLRERFAFLVRDMQGPDLTRSHELLDRAKLQIAKLKSLQKRTREEAEKWKDASALLQRAVNVLQEELRQEQLKTARLQKQLAASGAGDIVRLRPRADLE